MARKYLVRAWKVQYSNIPLLASLVSGLARYRPEIGIWVVDALLEEIRVGLEVG